MLAFLKRYQTSYPNVVFGDISKAFDSVHHKKLSATLQRVLGVPPTSKFIKYIDDMYDGLYHTTRIDQVYSEIAHQRVGIKQGCSLSPLLFVIYFNQVIEKIKNGKYSGEVAVLAFADDVAICVEKQGYKIKKNRVKFSRAA